MKRAFTLIELLVVLAIVSILASLLVLTIGGATGLSQMSLCKNYQRQLALATAAYQNDFDVHPPAVTYVQEDGMTVLQAWDEEAVLWQYLDRKATQMVCPLHVNSTGSVTGFNYNISFIGSEDYLFADPVQGIASSDCKHPAHCALFGDCAKNKYMRSPVADPIFDPFTDAYTRCAGMQAFRHQGMTNVAWLDGHVSSQSESFNLCDDDQAVGFLSEDNAAYDPRVLSLD